MLYVCGPINATDDVILALSPLCMKINSSCTESYKKEPEPPIDPLSNILIPANLIAGLAVFKFTMFAPMLTADAVIFCKDELP